MLMELKECQPFLADGAGGGSVTATAVGGALAALAGEKLTSSMLVLDIGVDTISCRIHSQEETIISAEKSSVPDANAFNEYLKGQQERDKETNQMWKEALGMALNMFNQWQAVATTNIGRAVTTTTLLHLTILVTINNNKLLVGSNPMAKRMKLEFFSNFLVRFDSKI